MNSNTSIILPSSKSISNRLLILQKTSGIPLIINNLSSAEDTKLLSDLLNRIEKTFFLNCENCGTAYRFLTAYSACLPGKWILDGSGRMRNRPIKPLVDTLESAGADIFYLGESGFPPLQINGKKLTASHWKIDAQQSSQYVSAVAMILPLIGQNSEIEFSSDGNSLQYIDMTIKLMQQLGLHIGRTDNKIMYIEKKKNDVPVSFFVEYDWTSAAVWYAFAALSPQKIFNLNGLKHSDLQADSIIAQWGELFGVQTLYTENGVQLINAEQRKNKEIIQLDCRNNPDLVPYLASICVGLRQKAVLENVQNLSIKESNRIEALMQELGKIACLKYENNALIINPNREKFPSVIHFSSHGDHRIAMSLQALSACIQNVQIDDTECVKKSYPEFEFDLE
ncbi:MAG: hypothetical protein FWH36_03295 [Lentimicrobiaceae bacterium]|nr:hypothetical protein [Lentimicrobiaceae bacterium]